MLSSHLHHLKSALKIQCLQYVTRTSCNYCQLPTTNHYGLCSDCRNTLPWLGQHCPRCALPLATDISAVCGQCQKNPPLFHYTVAPFHYQKPIAQFISRLKYQHQLSYAVLLGELFTHHLRTCRITQPLPQAIIPIPLHWRRLCYRGFNQAIELAKPTSRYFRIPILRSVLRRNRYTATQTQLAANRRRANVDNAFICKPLPKLQHIVVIDDVITTAHTIHAAVKAIISSNPHLKIGIWCIARTTQDQHRTKN